MITKYGKFIRRIRMREGQLLYDMAKLFGERSYILSSVECGRVPIPESWHKKILDNYSLSDVEKLQLSNIFIKNSSKKDDDKDE